jgi:hypothetical protein
MALFVCPCDECGGCNCGICHRAGCECECHQLDALPNDNIKQILIRYGNYDTIDVQHLTRNKLFECMFRADDPEKILRRGVNMLVKLQSQRGDDLNQDVDEDFLRELASFSSSDYARRTTCTPEKEIMKKRAPVKKIAVKPKAKPKAKPKPKSSAPKRTKTTKTAAQKKRERALARCVT